MLLWRSARARTALAGLLCVGSISACMIAPPEALEADAVEGLGDGKADGYVFAREVAPSPISLFDRTLEGQFDDARYVAYRFTTDESISLRARLRWDIEWRYGFYAPELHATIALFGLDSAAAAAGVNDPEALWHLQELGPRGTGTLERDIAPGTYMVIALANARAYRTLVRYALDVRRADSLLSPIPGSVELAIIDEEGRPATDLRVALGTAHALTDATGHAYLSSVSAGDHDLKLGDAGLGRAIYPPSVEVYGDGIQQSVGAIIAADAW